MKKITWLFAFLLSTVFADVKVEELKQYVLKVLPTLEGWCTKEKALRFVDLVLEIKPETCVEIGAFGGSSVFPVAASLKALGKGTLIAIEPWDKIECIKYFDPIEDADHLKWWGTLNINYIYHAYLNMLKKHQIDGFVKTIRATSFDAASQIGTIDLLHIDGNHSEIISNQDVTMYLPKVRKGGYIFFNDAISRDRQDAIDLLLEECDVVQLLDNGNCLLFKKRE